MEPRTLDTESLLLMLNLELEEKKCTVVNYVVVACCPIQL